MYLLNQNPVVNVIGFISTIKKKKQYLPCSWIKYSDKLSKTRKTICETAQIAPALSLSPEQSPWCLMLL